MADFNNDPSSASPHNPLPIFNANAPDPFLRDVLRCVLTGWTEADRRVRDEFDEAERHDLFPHHRRAIIERELRGVAKRHGFTGTSEKNRRKTSSFSRVVCNRVILTASAVREPTNIVRYAEFRLGFARTNQLTMFGEPETVSPTAPLYALLLHGPGAVEMDDDGKATISTKKPGFVDIVFPAPVAGVEKQIEYLPDRVHLLSRFPDVVSAKSGVTTEVVKFAVAPTLRKHSTSKEAGA